MKGGSGGDFYLQVKNDRCGALLLSFVACAFMITNLMYFILCLRSCCLQITSNLLLFSDISELQMRFLSFRVCGQVQAVYVWRGVHMLCARGLLCFGQGEKAAGCEVSWACRRYKSIT